MESADEILAKLKHYRKNILLLLFRHGELRTRELRDKAGFPSGSKEHHLGMLTEWGLIEEVGRTSESGGIPERVFDLTDDGREFVDEHLTDEEDLPDSYELRVQRLEDEVDELQTANRKQGEHLEDLEDRFETLVGWMEDQDLL